MKSLKITKHTDTDYVVDVSAGNVTRDYPFDNKEELDIFVRELKRDGYVVVNDMTV